MTQGSGSNGSTQLLQGEGAPSFVNPQVNNNNNNVSRGQSPFGKRRNGCCGMIPQFQVAFLVIIVILGGCEMLAWCVNEINSAGVDIYLGERFLSEEDVAVGWDSLSILTVTDDYAGETNFVYSDQCGADDCKYCIIIDWCTLETKGTEWMYGVCVRVACAIVLTLFWIVMACRLKMCQNNNNNYDNVVSASSGSIDEYQNYKTPYYRGNFCLMCLYVLIALGWAVSGVVSVHMWNDNNPIYDFDSVTWSFSLVLVCIESSVLAIFLVALLFDFCKFR